MSAGKGRQSREETAVTEFRGNFAKTPLLYTPRSKEARDHLQQMTHKELQRHTKTHGLRGQGISEQIRDGLAEKLNSEEILLLVTYQVNQTNSHMLLRHKPAARTRTQT